MMSNQPGSTMLFIVLQHSL